jgi:hypothetical protein
MFAQPQAEHTWLEQLTGDWTFETECRMGPDQPPMISRGTASCRSLGGLWALLQIRSDSTEEGGSWTALMTIGYDPAAGRYVGTFVGSMMTHLWVYQGSLDESKRRLVLDTTGPKFDGSGIGPYQDIVEVANSGEWILSSQMLGDDGQWNAFMTSRYRRAAEGATSGAANAAACTVG